MTTTTMGRIRTTSPQAANPAAPARDRYQTLQVALFTAGAVLMPAGLIAVGLGWYGAAHSRYAYDQFPYLLSGGLLGVCLTTLGGFLYFGAWQAKVASDQKVAMKQIADTMLVLADVVSRQRHEVGSAGMAQAADPGAVPVVAGENGAAVHRRDCALIAHRTDLRVLSGSDTGLTSCRVCSPTLI